MSDDTCGLLLDDRTGTDVGGGPSPLLKAGSMLGGVLKDLADAHTTRQGGGWTGGLRCGFPMLDNELRGFRLKTATVLAAEPNIGKSSFANQIAYQITRYPNQKAASLYISFENDPANLIVKHLSRISGWTQNDLEEGQIAPGDEELRKAALQLAQSPLFYLRGNSTVTPSLMIERAMEVRGLMGEGVELFLVIDYLQYFSRFANARTGMDQIAQALASLREIADTTGAAMLVISSQNRETNKEGKASMHGGRGSGEIEYDADTCLSLTKKDGGSGGKGVSTVTLTATKTRFGGVGTISDMKFHQATAWMEA